MVVKSKILVNSFLIYSLYSALFCLSHSQRRFISKKRKRKRKRKRKKMRTSLKKLRGFSLAGRHDRAGDIKELQQSVAQFDELSRASEDVQEMKDFYDSLLSAAAAITNSAYEFSESLSEMGTCLLEKTALNDDEQSGKVLLMLGKVQYELQKLVDDYRSHIVKTITSPSESLINQLQILEDMKRQCDEKRSTYEYMVASYSEKGRLKGSKTENFSYQQLQAARDAYDEEANFFVFRLKSLKVGLSRSLLTQASRHHAAQLCFFRRALKSLQAIEPHVKLIAENQHFDYQFSDLEDDDGDDDCDDVEDSNDHGGRNNAYDYGKLSFDYGQLDDEQDAVSTPRKSMELDHVDLTFPQVAVVDAAKENLDRKCRDGSLFLAGGIKFSSQSAPIFSEKKFNPPQRFIQLPQPSSRKFCSYALPTPDKTKNPASRGADGPVSQTKRTCFARDVQNYRNSSPLQQKKFDKILGCEWMSGPIILNASAVPRGSNNNVTPTTFPPPLAEKLPRQNFDPPLDFETKNLKRQAFSGPLNKSSKSVSSASSRILLKGTPQLFSGPLLCSPMPLPSSLPKLSPGASPTRVPSPVISELHELPRPPADPAARPSNQIGHSGPLVSKNREISAANNLSATKTGSLFPTPPQTVPLPHSFSVGSRVKRVMISLPATPSDDAPQPFKMMAEDIASPPLTPIAFPNLQPASTA